MAATGRRVTDDMMPAAVPTGPGPGPGPGPALTIIIPTYNRPRLLRGCLDALARQRHPQTRVLVISDGCAAEHDVEGLVRRHPLGAEIRCFPNAGESVAVNRGLAAATTPFVLVLSDDDKLHPDWIATGLPVIRNGDAVAVYPDWAVIDLDDHEHEHHHLTACDGDTMLADHWCTPGPGTIFRRDAALAIGGRDPRFRTVTDFDFWLRLSLHGHYAHVGQTGAYWRLHDANMSFRYDRKASAEHLRVIRRHLRRRARNGIGTPAALRRRALATAHLAAAVIHSLDARTRRAAWHFRRAWHLDQDVVREPPRNLATYPAFYPDWLSRLIAGRSGTAPDPA